MASHLITKTPPPPRPPPGRASSPTLPIAMKAQKV